MAKAKNPALARPDNKRPSIFLDKAGGDRVQGNITPIGSTRFEAARRRLAKLAAWEYERVSDGDTIEFLARGEVETQKYLASRPAFEAARRPA